MRGKGGHIADRLLTYAVWRKTEQGIVLGNACASVLSPNGKLSYYQRLRGLVHCTYTVASSPLSDRTT